MSEGIMQPTVNAVQCAVCKALHLANSDGYVLLTGRVFRPGIDIRTNNRVARKIRDMKLGDENSPKVVCDTSTCLLVALGNQAGDDDRY